MPTDPSVIEAVANAPSLSLLLTSAALSCAANPPLASALALLLSVFSTRSRECHRGWRSRCRSRSSVHSRASFCNLIVSSGDTKRMVLAALAPISRASSPDRPLSRAANTARCSAAARVALRVPRARSASASAPPLARIFWRCSRPETLKNYPANEPAAPRKKRTIPTPTQR